MSSLVEGFEYDVFISYRHNDNRSGWVTEFVKAQQEELGATIKDPVSVYFDTNPHDGLLEIHQANKSLEGKLKCLIFIPIISQTYCDPKSFAWQHEFCAFNTLAKQDPFGLTIKLKDGNVSSRILPIKIHELDPEDLFQIEHELGAPLRSIELIYKTAGVNRPLTLSDNPDRNLNRLLYRDQINKLANGIREILIALKNFEKPSVPVAPSVKRSTINYKKVSLSVFAAILIALFVSYVLFGIIDLIHLPNYQQQPVHKILLPFSIVSVVLFVARKSFRKMGQLLLQIVSVAIFIGGAIDITFTFVSNTMPSQHFSFLETNPESVSNELVRLEFAFLRALGAAMMAVGIGSWLLLNDNLIRERKANLLAVAFMFTLVESADGWAMYELNMPFFIYSILFLVMTWIGLLFWWWGNSRESISE